MPVDAWPAGGGNAMTSAPRRLLVGCLIAGLGEVGSPGLATSGQAANGHVRSGNPAIAMLIQRASERSNTFRSLLERIKASNGIVYIEQGTCGHGMRSCLVKVTLAESIRILWVMVDTRGDDCSLMASIGHELQHTVEVLNNPKVTSTAALYFFYRDQADAGRSPAFETIEAKLIGEAVRSEVRQRYRCINIR